MGYDQHMDEKEHLFESSGLVPEPGDSDALKKEKEALRCVCEKMMDANLNRKDAAVIIKNFNNIKDPEFKWARNRSVPKIYKIKLITLRSAIILSMFFYLLNLYVHSLMNFNILIPKAFYSMASY